jgi:PAS domain S-box-containing protein
MPHASTEHRPGRILKYSAALLVIVLLAYAAVLVSQSWHEAKAKQASQLETIAALSGNSIDIYFTQLQIGMLNLSADMAVTNKKSDLDRAFTLVSRFQALHTELDNVMLIRGDGQILLTGTTPNRPDLPTLSGDPAFKKICDELLQGSPFVIGRPVTGNIDKRWIVSARYAVTDRQGRLAYIISANLPVDMMQRYWIDAITPHISTLGLVRDDGSLVSQYPEPDAASLDKLYGRPAEEGALTEYLRANNRPQQGQMEMLNRDGKMSLLVLRRLQHYPLTLFVEMPVAEVKTAWWQAMHAPYFLMALVLACAFVFYGLRNQRRAWSVEKRRKELQRHYEHALRNRSPNEIFMFDTDTLQFTFANEYALENLGYTLEQLQQKTVLALHPDSSIESFGARLDMLRLGERESIIYETVQARADGSTYPVEVTLQLIKSEDGVARYLAITHDLTARKEAEENLRKFNAPVERRGSRG